MAFVDDMTAQDHTVESTCRVLREQGCPVAARTYRSWKQPGRTVAARTLTDAVLADLLIGLKDTPEGLYGRRKMTHYLRREGHQVAFCTVDRLMRDLGMNGVRRGKGIRTTVRAKAGQAPEHNRVPVGADHSRTTSMLPAAAPAAAEIALRVRKPRCSARIALECRISIDLAGAITSRHSCGRFFGLLVPRHNASRVHLIRGSCPMRRRQPSL